jgi:hypothetical protein
MILILRDAEATDFTNRHAPSEVKSRAQFNTIQAKRLKFGNRPFRHQKRTGLHALCDQW